MAYDAADRFERSDLSGLPKALRDDVRLLGSLLGHVIADHRGGEFVARIEVIRALAKRARRGSQADWALLSTRLAALRRMRPRSWFAPSLKSARVILTPCTT